MKSDAHELWAAAQLAPNEAIEDGVARVGAILTSREARGEVVAWIDHNPGRVSRMGITTAGLGLGFGLHNLYAHPAAQEAAKPVEQAVGDGDQCSKNGHFYDDGYCEFCGDREVDQ